MISKCEICGFYTEGVEKGLFMTMLDGCENTKPNFVCFECLKLFDNRLEQEITNSLKQYNMERWTSGKDVFEWGTKEESQKARQLHCDVINLYNRLLQDAKIKRQKSWYYWFKDLLN